MTKGEVTTMIYELRIYECAPGRLPALNERFRTITCRKFEQHGIKVVGYWEDVIGESNRLSYICQFDDIAARDLAWKAFQADSEWIAARAKSEESGPIVARVINTIMRPTDYSPLQ
jgi:hypothetical protein